VSQVSTQLKQYHDDLLAACLELLLALPDEIVITHLNIVIPALQVCFFAASVYVYLHFQWFLFSSLFVLKSYIVTYLFFV